jgi:predicted fused transcriptional regulator/phosphomethylpyrimidine kinase
MPETGLSCNHEDNQKEHLKIQPKMADWNLFLSNAVKDVHEKGVHGKEAQIRIIGSGWADIASNAS